MGARPQVRADDDVIWRELLTTCLRYRLLLVPVTTANSFERSHSIKSTMTEQISLVKEGAFRGE